MHKFFMSCVRGTDGGTPKEGDRAEVSHRHYREGWHTRVSTNVHRNDGLRIWTTTYTVCGEDERALEGSSGQGGVSKRGYQVYRPSTLF